MWFGDDAIERNLADKLQTFDDLLLELHRDGVAVYAVSYKAPDASPLSKLGLGTSSSQSHVVGPRMNWFTRGVAAALGLPLHGGPSPHFGAAGQLPDLRDPRYA